MHEGVIHCTPETSIRAVARMMASHGVHAVYVFDYGAESDEDVEPWGLVSDLDVAAAASGHLDEQTAGDSSVRPLLTVTSDKQLSEAAELMTLNGIAHLAVLDPATQRPVGVISTLDIARSIAAEPTPAARRGGRRPITAPTATATIRAD
jgi:CBS domain-containing protein